MTDDPIAYAVHDGSGMPPEWRRQLIAAWLTANDVDPADVSPHHPISILTVPFRSEDAAGGGPWLIQVIYLTQYFTGDGGKKEQNLITRKPVTFPRTVPLKVTFPPASITAAEGTTHGEAEGQAAQEAPQEVVRPAREAEVPHTGQGACEERSVQGSAERIEGHPEEDPRQGHEEVPQPEEVGSEEETVIGRKGEG